MYSTLTFTVNAVAKVLQRVKQDTNTSYFLLKEAAGRYDAKIRHTSYVDKVRQLTVERHTVELVHTQYGTVNSPTDDIIRKAYFVFENDYNDSVGAQYVPNGVVGFLTTTVVGELYAQIN
jgi:hypothetical protein